MLNKAMQRKLESGEAIDVADAPRLGPYYILEEVIDGRDYCDAKSEAWIWSIGRAERELSFKFDGVTHLVRAGTILASPATDLYQRDGFQCLWLR